MARPLKKERGLYTRKNVIGRVWWYYRVYLDGREQRGGPYETKGEAKAARENLTSDHRRGKVDPHGGWRRIDDVLDQHVRDRGTKKDQASQRRFARWWKARCHAEGLTRIKDLTVRFLHVVRHELAHETIKIGPKPRAVRYKRRKLPVGKLAEAVGKVREPGTINRYFRWLQASLGSVKQTQRQLFDDWTWESESTGRTRYVSPDDEAKLAHALGPYAPWMRLAILSGMRQTEQFRLQWKDVDLEQRVVTLGQTKAGQVQYVHLSEEAAEILRKLDSWQRSKWVFPSEGVGPLDTRNFYNRVWIRAVKRAGIEWATWHDLRHCYGSRLALAGHNETTISALLRHSTTSMSRRYTHLNKPHLRQAVESVARVGKESVAAASQNQTGNKPETKGSEGERNGKPESVEVGVVKGENIGAPDTN